MNIFNRIVIVILLILIILVSAAAIVLPRQTFEVWLNLGTTLDQYTSDFTGWVLMTLVLLAVIVLCLVLLWLEFRRKTQKTVRVEKISGGQAQVAVASVVQRLQYHLDQLPQVLSTKPKVTAKGKKVNLDIEVKTTQDVNIPAKTEEISQVAHQVVKEQMGLKLGKVVITVRHAAAPPLERKRPAPPAPKVEPTPPTPVAPPAEPQTPDDSEMLPEPDTEEDDTTPKEDILG